MWWKILIAVLSGVLFISNIDLIPLIPFDDIIYAITMVSSIVSAIKGLKPDKSTHTYGQYNDVDDN